MVRSSAQGKCSILLYNIQSTREPEMIDQKTLDELTDKLSNAIPDGIKVLKSDLENNVRAVLEATLRNMNLVSREEFDVQAALLTRSLERLKQLEQQVAELEKNQP
jgi:hypothetical protein